MEKLRIKVHPTFIIFACILIYFGKSLLFFNYLLVMFLHELAHMFVARRLGYNIRNIKIIPFGISLNINSYNLMPKDEIKIALAGPIINFLLAICLFSLWWIFPETFNYTYLFGYANLVTGLFNLIPAFPLDGGRVLLSIFKQGFNNKKAIKYSKILNVVLIIVLLSLFIWSCFTQLNVTYLFVILCILSGIFEKNEGEKYSLINYGLNKKISKIVKVKHILISSDQPLYKVCRHIDNFSYIWLSISDEDKNVIRTLTEREFLNILEKNESTKSFYDVL